ncbi:hypothetical protein DDB_G0271172 [Dictyostelium discoideum AX4]|uniref:Uncharacterized protein n=1 Tax=Dictyostelium discoideum TaxID=44689 RepID=Q55B48_DICDI|nr:hypothetical protein DDB_G0271172 [Dictyostelium discoideum AX4]EAL71716.1 hypothetical protein DDB_G0271172 [Dictyostelium discoideum AX4]|eukprot:XP_645764.1 hypothetical protein DDB_G0271172 [Dictyostelium discoideum AX4]
MVRQLLKKCFILIKIKRKNWYPKDLVKIIEKVRLNKDEDGVSHMINQNQCQQHISNHYKADNHSAIIKAYYNTEPTSRIEATKLSSKNKLQRDIEITKRKSTDDLVEKAIEHSTTEVRSTHEAATTSNNGGITTQSNKNKTGKKRANQLQSDADFFTKRFSNETSSVSNKRVSRRVDN